MIMTPEEQIDMLNMIKDMRDLNEKKNDLMQEIIFTAQAVAEQNIILQKENEMLKRHIDIAEKALQRFQTLESLTERREAEQYSRGIWEPARSVSESIANGWSGA